jgi:hypothetical protein
VQKYQQSVKQPGILLILLFQICQNFDAEKTVLVEMVIWSLWRCRNTKLWENKLITAAKVLLTAKDYMHDWLLLQQIAPNQPQHAAKHKWLKPPQVMLVLPHKLVSK